MAIPPYLTSGASSRAHHALIVALNEAKSVQEEDAIVEREIRRAREVLSSRGAMSKISETLVVLLHCSMMGGTAHKLDWALMPALQLAEGGKTVDERRIGYLYLCERLPKGHELELMLINTIRKDLTSSSVSDVILGLHATTHLPSDDLLPAVTPLLTAKTLLRHGSGLVRHKTLSALAALFFHESGRGKDGIRGRARDPRLFPLNMAKLVKLLSKETEFGPAGVTLRLMSLLLTGKTHLVRSEEERMFLVETVIAQTKRADAGTQISLDALRVLEVLVKGNHATSDVAVSWIASKVKSREINQAFLLEACSFVSGLPAALSSSTSLLPAIVKHLSVLLLPHSTSSTGFLPKPNNHILVLRCLSCLPPGTWDTLLGEGEMRVIMEGLNSVDDSVRLATLRLLQNLSPELLPAAFQNHLESLLSSLDLALPLRTPDGLDVESKLRRGRDETACRALEVVHIQSSALPDDQAGETLSLGVQKICETLSGVEDEARVWEAGLKAVLAILQDGTIQLREAFAKALLLAVTSNGPNHTLAVLRATTSVEFGHFDADTGCRAIATLLEEVSAYSSSIQEVLLIASVGIMSRLPSQSQGRLGEILNGALGKVRGNATSYLQKRCDQIERVVSDQNLLIRLDQTSHTRALPDILANLIQIAKPPQSPESISHASTSRPLATSTLRYDAYSLGSRSASRSLSRSRPALSPSTSFTRSSASPAISAGEYALFSADDYNDQSALLDGEEKVDNLVGLTLGERRSSRQTARRVSDPFRNDSDDPTTPRLR